MTFSSIPIENSIVEPHHRALVEKIPPEQYKAYLTQFIAMFVLEHGSAGLRYSFPKLAEWWVDPPLWQGHAPSFEIPSAGHPGEVTLASANPADADQPPVAR